MIKVTLTALLLLLLRSVTMIFHDQNDTPIFMPTSVGTVWIYQDQDGDTHSVSISESQEKKDKTIVSLTKEHAGKKTIQEKIEITQKGLFRIVAGKDAVNPPICLLKLPVKDGESWDTTFYIGKAEIRGSAKINGPLKLKVPAGTFETFCVTDESASGMKVSIWFAPSVGPVKVSCGDVTYELKEFIPTKK